MGKYDYLKQFIGNNDPYPSNSFYTVSNTTIVEEEKRLNFQFPEALKEFWLEIGYGFLVLSTNGNQGDCNRISSPSQIADMILLKDTDYVLDEVAELMSEGDIPFFEVGDSSSYLVMNYNARFPEGVYNLGSGDVDLVEEHFEDFIRRLYYESSTFYCHKYEPGYRTSLRVKEE